LGANALLATSAALLRAQANVEGMEVYELVGYLCEYSSITLPFAFFNCIGGGAHVPNSNVRIQEMMVIPIGTQNFRLCFEAAITLQKYLHMLLEKKFPYVAYTAQGALTAPFKDDAQALDLLMEAIEAVQKASSHRFLIGLDVAASQFYNRSTKTYDWFGRSLQSADLIDLYTRLVNQYPIFAIEDGLSERDEQGWKDMTSALEEKVQLIGDDIFATNPELIAYGIEHNVATGVAIKPNQIGTITETLQAIKMCREYEILCLLSNRAYETNDPLIVELAVGTSAGYIKAGGPNRGEHLAKYNELLRIEDSLMLSLLDS
jgi:enolase